MGGALRDAIRRVDAHDWDLASSAAPEQVQALFPGSVYENAFGTVALRVDGLAEPLQITTFRRTTTTPTSDGRTGSCSGAPSRSTSPGAISR